MQKWVELLGLLEYTKDNGQEGNYQVGDHLKLNGEAFLEEEHVAAAVEEAPQVGADGQPLRTLKALRQELENLKADLFDKQKEHDGLLTVANTMAEQRVKLTKDAKETSYWR